MKEMGASPRRLATTLSAGLMCLSVVCLCAGGMFAAAQHGVLRVLFGASGFAGYVYLFARALEGFGFSRSGAP